MTGENDNADFGWGSADQEAFVIGYEIVASLKSDPLQVDLLPHWQELGDEFYRVLGAFAVAQVRAFHNRAPEDCPE